MDSRFINTNPYSSCGCKNDNEKSNGDEESSENSFVSALSMSGGDGDNSYSTSSLLQRNFLSMAMPMLVKNTKEMITNLEFPRLIKVADLGCSSGETHIFGGV
ncbi:salicylate/benzoate carboxyl methyltransferase-like [Raphanus sativus]|uniref:Salicylate/benzoate carboxyl methyltransferase-like n=1 Tax=Raphanus sativus TaxID=3726 RepID=A0A6J0K9B7_RAPSA|nr:salicylate/benzoate carboxyl methyltransferase-like [Raphanus sativus]